MCVRWDTGDTRGEGGVRKIPYAMVIMRSRNLRRYFRLRRSEPPSSTLKSVVVGA